jgi:hypothetical protein
VPRQPDDGKPIRHQDRRGMEQLEAYINQILDSEPPDLLAEFFKKPERERERIIQESMKEYREWRLADAVAAAEHGDMRPACALVDAAVRKWLGRSPLDQRNIPSLSRFLQKPLPGPGGVGKRLAIGKGQADKAREVAYDTHLLSLTLAVKDAARIQEIVKERNWPRLTGDFSPMAIAARRHGVEESQALKWQKSKRRPHPDAK